MRAEGKMKQKYYKLLWRIFGFNIWHITPYSERPYAKGMVKDINYMLDKSPQRRNSYIVEVGCGLGDIISGIRADRKWKLGLDVDKKVIRAAKIAHPGNRFMTGSFSNLHHKKIRFLIAVNFLHTLDGQTVEHLLGDVIKENQIQYIVVDKVESPAYQYAHDYDAIMCRNGYVLYKKSKRYEAYKRSSRWILIFKRDKGFSYAKRL